MSLIRVPIYPTRNLAAEIDPGARSIVAGTGVSFVVNADGSITINSTGLGGTVTSVGMTTPTGLTVTGSPITTSGVLALSYTAGYVGYTTAEQTKLAGIAPGAQPGTVTSVNASGGTTGLTFSGGPVTTTGTLTLAGTLAIANGGTGATTAAAARTNLGAGTVTSIGAIGSTGLTISGSPVTTSGSITYTLSANLQSWSGIAPASKADTTALASYVLKAGDTMTGELLRTIAGLANNTSALWLRAYSDNSAGEVSLSYARGAVSSQGGINFNVANGAANNVTPLRLTPASGIPVFTTRVHNMTGTVSTQAVLRYMGWNNEVNRWSEVMEAGGELAYYSYDSSGSSPSRVMYISGPSMGTKQMVVDSARLIVANDDIYTYRSGGTTGVIFFTSTGTRYLYYNGTNYEMPGAALSVSGGSVSDQYSDLREMGAIVSITAATNAAQAHSGRPVVKTNSSAFNYTLQPNASVAIRVGTILTVINDGSTTANLTIARGAGVQLWRGGVDANITVAPGNSVSMVKVATDRWQV